MIKLENLTVDGFEAALRGMRNPLNSWDKSDSFVGQDGMFYVGENDLDLMKRLCKAGTEHRKFMRMMHISMDVVAPRYWWTEFDTYTFADRNSCSTMHKIMEHPFTRSDFSFDHIHPLSEGYMDEVIDHLNTLRVIYLQGVDGDYEPKDKEIWYSLIALLPQSYMQRATISFNYETAANIIRQRSNHKLEEWHTFCDTLKAAPYMSEILGLEETEQEDQK